MPDDPRSSLLRKRRRTDGRGLSTKLPPHPPAELAPSQTAADPLLALYGRPGFKLRRAHQISLSVFADECGAYDVTTTQFGVLMALRHRPGLDQIGLAQVLGLDRSTTGMVVGLLERRALLSRDRPSTDHRRRVLNLTTAGQALLEALAPATERARLRLLGPLSQKEAATLHTLLDRLLSYHDAGVRVPLRR